MTSKNRSFLPVLGYGPYWLSRNSPPTLHVTTCMTGGLKKFINRLSKSSSTPKEEEHHEQGFYTDADGVFCPEQGMPLLASRYKFLEVIGKGQSSVLVKARDTFCGDKCVAIKLLHAHYMKLGPQEVDCMRRLNIADPYDVSSTLRLKTVFKFDEHYSIVFELLYPRPLADIFRSIPKDEVIPSLRKVAKNLLKALGFLQQQGVIHADLKPENILLQKKGDLNSLKVVDFGNAIRCIHEELSLYYDDYELQTLLYRAPEVMFGLSFGLEIDMWSFGCILAELFTKKPLFPGRDKKQVLEKIVSILGPVPEDLCMSGKFFSDFKHYTSKKTKIYTTSDMMKYLGCRDYAFADFVTKLLKYKPADRMTIQEAACHPFLAAELGTSFFLSPGDRNMYSPLHLDSKAYNKSPFVSAEIKRLHLDSRALLRQGTCKAGNQVFVKADPVIKFEPKKVAEVLPMQRVNGVTSTADSNKRRKTQQNAGQNVYYQGFNASISFHVQLPGSTGNASSTLSVHSDQPIDYHRSATASSSTSECEVIDLTVSPEPEVTNSQSRRNFDGAGDASPYVPDQTNKFFPSSASCSSASASRDCDREQITSETNSFHTTSDTMMSWPKRPSPTTTTLVSGSTTTSSRSQATSRPERCLSLLLRPSSSSTSHHSALSEDSTSPVSTPDKTEPNLISDSSPGWDSNVTTPRHDEDPLMRNRPLKKRIRKSLFLTMPETPTDEPSVMPLTDHSSRETNHTNSDSMDSHTKKNGYHFPGVLSYDSNQQRKRTIAEMYDKPSNGVKTNNYEITTDQNHNEQSSLVVGPGKARFKRQKVEPDSTQSSREMKMLPDSKKELCVASGSPDIAASSLPYEESPVVRTPVVGRTRRSQEKKNLRKERSNGALSGGRHSGGKPSSKGKKGKIQIPRNEPSESSGSEELRLL